jgi:Spy/CpxP family protein refolding chaperone
MRSSWKKAVLAVAAAAAVMLAGAALGFSQGPPPGPHGFGGPEGLGPLLHNLNLTDDQKTQIKSLHESFATSTKALHDQLKALHDSAPDPLNGAAFDEAAVRAAAQSRAAIQVELDVAHAKLMSQVYGLLSADQKTQLAANRAAMQQQLLNRESRHQPPSSQF